MKIKSRSRRRDFIHFNRSRSQRAWAVELPQSISISRHACRSRASLKRFRANPCLLPEVVTSMVKIAFLQPLLVRLPTWIP
jgi:hypothetical protein